MKAMGWRMNSRMHGQYMKANNNVENQKVNSVVITEWRNRRGTWTILGSGWCRWCLVWGCVPLERKNADELGERINRELMCMKSWKTGEQQGQMRLFWGYKMKWKLWLTGWMSCLAGVRGESAENGEWIQGDCSMREDRRAGMSWPISWLCSVHGEVFRLGVR